MNFKTDIKIKFLFEITNYQNLQQFSPIEVFVCQIVFIWQCFSIVELFGHPSFITDLVSFPLKLG